MTAQVYSLTPPAPIRHSGPEGYHNANLQKSSERILKGHTYKNLGTVCIVPTRGGGNFKARWVDNYNNLIKPTNHPYLTYYAEGFEVGDAFNQAIWAILNNPDLMKWNEGRGPWIFTLEDDNLPPPDALIRLLGDQYATDYSVISGLYWTKGEGGVPQIWGDPRAFPLSFAPQVPIPDTVQECRGTGMGCAVWDIKLFQDPRFRQGTDANGVPVWFKTWNSVENGIAKVSTQDLSAAEVANKLGYRFAVDTGVRVGHADWNTGTIW